MPTDKDFKRLVRRRMQKTGESYTAARAQLRKSEPSASAGPRPEEFARLAGRSDAIMKERTGCNWERWVKALDRAKAHTWSHREIAKYVSEKYKIPGWWAQSVTVGYERIKGLRAVGQRRDGTFEANKSRTFAVPLERLYHAFRDPRMRTRWLRDVDPTLRTATPKKTMRFTWPDRTSVVIGFLPKGPGKSQVAVQHGKLPDRQTSAQMKEFWADSLTALGRLLTET